MKIRAIAIDDDPVSMLLLRALASRVEYLDLFATHSDPVAGAADIILHDPDVLFLDMEMPEFNGIDVMRSLLKVPKTIVISGSPDFKASAFNLNAVSFLNKPLQEAEFRAVLDQVYQSVLFRK